MKVLPTLTLVVALLFGASSCADSTHAAEAERRFEDSRQDLNVLVRMLKDDIDLVGLSPASMFMADGSDRLIDPERIVEYRRLIKQLGFHGGFRRDGMSSLRFYHVRPSIFQTFQTSYLHTDNLRPYLEIEDTIGDSRIYSVKKLSDDGWYLIFEAVD